MRIREFFSCRISRQRLNCKSMLRMLERKRRRKETYSRKELHYAVTNNLTEFLSMPTSMLFTYYQLLSIVVCLGSLMETSLALATPKPNTILQVSMNETLPPIDYHVLPRVGKCCPIHQVLTKDNNGVSKCVPISETSLLWNSSSDDYSRVFTPYFSDFNRTGALAPGDRHDSFIVIVGDPCRFKKYILAPSESSEDEYYLLLNGSIFAPHHVPIMLSPGIDYCMELVPDLGTIALVCFPEESLVASADARTTFYACGLLISVPFLVLTIVAYRITPCLMDIHGKALCHYCACLAVAFATLAITQLASAYLSDQVCVSIAFIIQFSFVACFFWLNVMCIETWRQVRRHVGESTTDAVDGAMTMGNQDEASRTSRRDARRLFFYYSLWAWLPPLLLIVFSMIMDLNPTIPATYVKPNFGAKSCWFQSDAEAMPYFYVPVGLLVLANVVLFGLTAITITHHQRDLDLRRMARNRDSDREDQRIFRRLKRIFFVCVGLFFLMGLNWAMELISWWAGGDPLAWSAFDLINALQGLLVFGIFVMRKPVRTIVWYRVEQILGRETTEPDIGSADRSLLTVLNDDTLLSRRTVC